MKLLSNAMNPLRQSVSTLKVIAVVVCMICAFAVALIMKQTATVDRISTFNASNEPTPDAILAAIPPQTGKSASELAVTEAVMKARKSPSNVQTWVSLGDALAQRLRDSADQTYYHFAEKAYGEALRLKPTSADALNGMAWVTGGRHQFDESVAWANKAIAVAPDSADSYGILGDAALELGDYDVAFNHYQKMMDLRPDMSSWSRGGYLLWLTGDKAKAVELMEQAIRAGAPFAENNAWCRAKLATIHLHGADFSAAAQVLEPSLRVQSRNPHVLLAAAKLAAASGDFEVAEQYYQMLMEKGPNHDALVGLGDLRAIKGDQAAAESYYIKVEALHAAHLASGVHDHMQMAKFLADHDRNLVQALRLAEQHKLTRNVIEADVLAWVYLKNGDKARAVEAIKRALSRNTPDLEINYHAGMIAAAAGDVESATRHLQLAIALNPQFSLLQAPLARAMLEKISARETASAGKSEDGAVKASR